MTADQESNESKDRQKEGWHVYRLLGFICSKSTGYRQME